MTSPDPLELIQQRQADNRAAYARQVVANQQAMQSQQLLGEYAGVDADQGVILLQTADGGTVPCESLTSGQIVAGRTIAVSIPISSTSGMISGRPG